MNFTKSMYNFKTVYTCLLKKKTINFCARVIKQSFLKEATFFDPRFHRHFGLSATVCDFHHLKSQVVKRFKSDLNVTEVKKGSENIKTTDTSNMLKKNSVKCSSKSMKYLLISVVNQTGLYKFVTNNALIVSFKGLKTFFKRDDCIVNSKMPEDTRTDLDKEFEQYQMEETLDLDQSPALWWHQVASNYRQLSNIAKYYLTIPSCCMPNLCRLDAEQKHFILNRRKSLSQLCQTENKLWYLFYNDSFIKLKKI